MSPIHDSTRRARERLALLERREKARADAAEVAAGVAETVALSRNRGAGVEGPASPARAGPYRRRPGLDWLATKGRISPEQKRAGERYGALFRRAAREAAMPSTLAVLPGGGGPGLAEVAAEAERTALARARLAELRGRLGWQRDLVAACDEVCGRELTPREAAGEERAAGRLEAVLAVALDLLAGR